MACARSHSVFLALTLLLLALAPLADAMQPGVMPTNHDQTVAQAPVSQVAEEASSKPTDSKASLLSTGNNIQGPVDADKAVMQNMLNDLKGKSVDAAEPGAVPTTHDQAVEQAPVSQVAGEASSKPTDSKASLLSKGNSVQSPVDADKAVMQNMLNDLKSKPADAADDKADPALVTEDAQRAPASSLLLSAGETNAQLRDADSDDAAQAAPRQSTLQRVYAALVGKKERMAKPEYGLNIQRRFPPDPVNFATAAVTEEEPADIRRPARVSLLKKDRQATAVADAEQDDGVSLMQTGSLLSRGRSSQAAWKQRHGEL